MGLPPEVVKFLPFQLAACAWRTKYMHAEPVYTLTPLLLLTGVLW